jgi:hypothetical protein
VRNHILTRWRSDVSRFLTEDEAAAKIASRYRHLVPLAWRFLYRHGWINFGVAPAIMSYPQPAQKGSVVVVGAGLAGGRLMLTWLRAGQGCNMAFVHFKDMSCVCGSRAP